LEPRRVECELGEGTEQEISTRTNRAHYQLPAREPEEGTVALKRKACGSPKDREAEYGKFAGLKDGDGNRFEL
jgi:hypothetical protein